MHCSLKIVTFRLIILPTNIIHDIKIPLRSYSYPRFANYYLFFDCLLRRAPIALPVYCLLSDLILLIWELNPLPRRTNIYNLYIIFCPCGKNEVIYQSQFVTTISPLHLRFSQEMISEFKALYTLILQILRR